MRLYRTDAFTKGTLNRSERRKRSGRELGRRVVAGFQALGAEGRTEPWACARRARSNPIGGSG
jgi:hypothetical protein